ncbi:MAG: phosphate ABC transporter permease subunit PstC [Oscillospiraceae bacterium]|jgi:phosphate transport system permease protein|nr:phosphate ABC transporter permease subunit PstC [Oscillospiraceae bacterium]
MERSAVSVKAKFKERAMSAVFLISALSSILAVALICLFLFANGLPAIGKIGFFKFLLGREWSPSDIPPAFGIFPMIVGSLYVTAGAVIIGVPVGVLTAVFLARVCPKKIYKIVKPGVELLAGIPSVVYGFFGMVAIVPLTGNSILSACILLGIMILPTVIGLTESALRAVPEQYYEGALALGAGHYRSVFFVVLPAAKSGILAAVVLGIGRAVGETMAVIMVAGNQARMPVSLFKGVRTLTANIVIEMGYAAELHREALIATGVVLFVFILIINLSLSAFNSKRRKGL